MIMTVQAVPARRTIRIAPIPPPWPYDATAVTELERSVFHSQIYTIDDKTTPHPCAIRFLKRDDLDALDALNDLVLNHLPHPHILRPATRTELAQHIARRGRCIGAFVGDHMVAFTVLACPRDDPDNLGFDLGFERERRLRSCHFELSGVHPTYRGSGLHRTLNTIRAKFAGASGYHYLFGTVSPFNPYSLINHLAQGMTIRKLVTKYGGMNRYIVHRHYHERFIEPTSIIGAEYRPCLDIAGQKLLLNKGYWGIGMRRTGNTDWEVAYVPSAMVSFEHASVMT